MWGPSFLLLIVAAMMVAPAASQKKVVCYIPEWSVYRWRNKVFHVENMNASLCTHAIYRYMGVTWEGTVRKIGSYLKDFDNTTLAGFAQFNNLRLQNTDLKTLVGVGGYEEGSAVFSYLSANTKRRANFVSNLYNFVVQYGFNGLELAWQYPARYGGSKPADKANFVLLLKELRAKFAPAGLLLTAFVDANVPTVTTSYDVPQVAAQLDFINLITSDYHGWWEGRTGHNAPLYSSSGTNDSVDASVNFWLQQGAPAAKLVLTVTFYGQSFTLENKDNTWLGAPTSGRGAAGDFLRYAGILSYIEICILQKNPGWTVVRDPKYQVPYTFKEYLWVSYDDIESVGVKAEYAKTKGLGGVCAWMVDMDDYKGTCGDGAFPLLAKIKATLG